MVNWSKYSNLSNSCYSMVFPHFPRQSPNFHWQVIYSHIRHIIVDSIIATDFAVPPGTWFFHDFCKTVGWCWKFSTLPKHFSWNIFQRFDPCPHPPKLLGWWLSVSISNSLRLFWELRPPFSKDKLHAMPPNSSPFASNTAAWSRRRHRAGALGSGLAILMAHATLLEHFTSTSGPFWTPYPSSHSCLSRSLSRCMAWMRSSSTLQMKCLEPSWTAADGCELPNTPTQAKDIGRPKNPTS